ncbi:sensory box histidine kinase [Pseudomonas amygdali pv. mori str. 301020]|uniref:histidine kinase n=1 Tax=Pseudomonas amygdali pv. mori str. 301020 TaxID=629261 RepID=A0A656GBE0_PSEA0|nr:sensory box histidine kinase [Pseudomonas amygdali pv. mori str. 301020]
MRVAERTRELATANELLQAEIVERAMAEEVLRHAQKMDAIGQLTGGIAHDFNNVLSGVMGALDMIRLRVAAGRAGDIDRYLDAATSSANRAAALTRRLLTFARRQSLNVTAVDINRMVRSMEELLRGTVGGGAQLHIELEEGLSSVCTDEHQLENALLNLVINARDAVAVGGRLRVRSQLLTLAAQKDGLAPSDYVRLSVEDNGWGMAQDVIDRAFDPFFTTKPAGQGTGLGLSMVYGFIKQAGGHVQIKSHAGQGTQVHLLLPCAMTTA